eukprot:UN09821
MLHCKCNLCLQFKNQIQTNNNNNINNQIIIIQIIFLLQSIIIIIIITIHQTPIQSRARQTGFTPRNSQYQQQQQQQNNESHNNNNQQQQQQATTTFNLPHPTAPFASPIQHRAPHTPRGSTLPQPLLFSPQQPNNQRNNNAKQQQQQQPSPQLPMPTGISTGLTTTTQQPQVQQSNHPTSLELPTSPVLPQPLAFASPMNNKLRPPGFGNHNNNNNPSTSTTLRSE